ncbi:MAG: M20/M25/M40 family metallo-hydrolase [Deltaproteobacteria bacterium]|nr:M20/M25/M40 family metallo-hydrolase [Deltaproteobacteria bacterium]MBI2211884.1 M20/M25/M40 family metallo-hydrolase [Deltaproteobacteria bacterium]MBI2349798.1 M20/M25/M40 family metallo-hydrolase [Deltaproteobacteria bacterium]MBI3061282.1 M20/M25/M40 family metallo-hydrolase [Deltaproteobacteria bacterium]
MSDRSDLVALLKRLLALPTAPFHENFVRSFLCGELKKAGIAFEIDSYGNIVAGSGDGDDPVACVAHMDHPGFEIVEAGKERAQADWFGGVDARYFIGARVVVYNQSTGGVSGRGVVEKISKSPQGRVKKMTLAIRGSVARGDFGSWDLVPFRRRGKLIDTKAADDLVGCAVILTALKELKERGVRQAVRGIFTRAEEQGFIGTLGMIRGGYLPASTKVVSIETSKALPGVLLGGGPVIRLGDRASMFHHQMVHFMDYVARETRKRDRRFSYQRRVMDGGTCEATPYQLNGHITGGIAVPLHNYHNQGKARIAPEGVHLKDVAGAARLLVGMVERWEDFNAPTEEIRKRFESLWQKYGGRLEAEPKD